MQHLSTEQYYDIIYAIELFRSKHKVDSIHISDLKIVISSLTEKGTRPFCDVEIENATT